MSMKYHNADSKTKIGLILEQRDFWNNWSKLVYLNGYTLKKWATKGIEESLTWGFKYKRTRSRSFFSKSASISRSPARQYQLPRHFWPLRPPRIKRMITNFQFLGSSWPLQPHTLTSLCDKYWVWAILVDLMKVSFKWWQILFTYWKVTGPKLLTSWPAST